MILGAILNTLSLLLMLSASTHAASIPQLKDSTVVVRTLQLDEDTFRVYIGLQSRGAFIPDYDGFNVNLDSNCKASGHINNQDILLSRHPAFGIDYVQNLKSVSVSRNATTQEPESIAFIVTGNEGTHLVVRNIKTKTTHFFNSPIKAITALGEFFYVLFEDGYITKMDKDRNFIKNSLGDIHLHSPAVENIISMTAGTHINSAGQSEDILILTRHDYTKDSILIQSYSLKDIFTKKHPNATIQYQRQSNFKADSALYSGFNNDFLADTFLPRSMIYENGSLWAHSKAPGSIKEYLVKFQIDPNGMILAEKSIQIASSTNRKKNYLIDIDEVQRQKDSRIVFINSSQKLISTDGETLSHANDRKSLDTLTLLKIWSEDEKSFLFVDAPRTRFRAQGQNIKGQSSVISLRSPYSPQVGSSIYAFEQNSILWELNPLELHTGNNNSGSRRILKTRNLNLRSFALINNAETFIGLHQNGTLVMAPTSSKEEALHLMTETPVRTLDGTYTYLEQGSENEIHAVSTSGDIVQISSDGTITTRLHVGDSVASLARDSQNTLWILTSSGQIFSANTPESKISITTNASGAFTQFFITENSFWVLKGQTVLKINRTTGFTHERSLNSLIENTQNGNTITFLGALEDQLYIQIGSTLHKLEASALGTHISNKVISESLFGEDLRKFGINYMLHNPVMITQARNTNRSGDCADHLKRR